MRKEYSEGQVCINCKNGVLYTRILSIKGKKRKRIISGKQKYYFTQVHKCNYCKRLYNSEKYKVYVTDKLKEELIEEDKNMKTPATPLNIIFKQKNKLI